MNNLKDNCIFYTHYRTETKKKNYANAARTKEIIRKLTYTKKLF